jgi:chemosensory pili system protein ChpA (sensor histidine kinase/response regulator)
MAMNETAENLSVESLAENAEMTDTPNTASGAPGYQLLPELLNGFVAEAKSYLPKIQTALQEYERQPQQTELLAEAQRHVRTLKGAAAVVGLVSLSDSAISFEEVLERLAAGQMPFNSEVLSALNYLLMQLDQYLDATIMGVQDQPVELAQALKAVRNLTNIQTVQTPLTTPSQSFQVPSRITGSLRPLAQFIPPAPIAPSTLGAPLEQTEAEMQTGPDLSAWLDLNDEDEALPFLASDQTASFAPLPLPSMQQPFVAEVVQQSFDEVIKVKDTAELADAPVRVEWPPLADLPSVSELTELAELLEIVAIPPAVPAEIEEQYDPASAVATQVTAELPASMSARDEVIEEAESLEPAPELEAESEPQMPDIPAELLEVFLPEAEEHLRVMTLSLPALAAQPGNKALLQEIRRSAHSLKGSAAVVGFQEITKLAHRAEDLLDLLYDDELTLTPDLLQLLFVSTEALENLLNQRADQELLCGLYEAYAEVLEIAPQATSPEKMLEAFEALAEPAQPKRTTKPLQNGESAAQPAIPIEKEDHTVASVNRGKYVRVPIEQLDAVVKLVTELLVNHTAFEQNMTSLSRQLEEIHTNSTRLNRVASKMEVQFEASTLGGRQTPARRFSATTLLNNFTESSLASGFTGGLAAPLLNQNTYGFDALELDRYTEFHLLLRELTEAASDVQALESELIEIKDYFQSNLQREARLCGDIQEKLMRLRMVPLATLASRLHRTVHTVATRRSKLVNLVLEGEETRLDKTVIEEIADPLLHILRNAIDHGIEAPEAREAKGKSTHGTIRLRAFHDNTQTVIQIGDDGGGLDPERIRQTALKNGLLSAADAAQLSNEELFSLIFLPGFSTAEEVSEISGRGVGMDVVKTAVHRLKGSISLDSQPDQGTIFTLRLPMTLAVMRALMVKTQQQIFAIPLSGLAQVVKLTPHLLDHIGQDVIVRTGGKVYPLLQLSKLLNLKRQDANPTTQMALLMNLEDHQVALAVDETLGGREIVVKNLGNHLRHVHGLTGATLLGDGSAVLILNLPELLRDVFRPRAVTFEMRTEPKPPAPAPLPIPKISAPVVTSAPPVINVPAPKPAAGPLTVMVVDDSLSVRRVLTNRLTSAGWNPLQAKDGLDALDQLQQMTIPPDLLLVDIEMPRMDGYEFINTLRKQFEYAHLPVIVLTSRAGQKHRDRAFEVGATEYLVKPYQDDVLLSLIRRLANRRSHDE